MSSKYRHRAEHNGEENRSCRAPDRAETYQHFVRVIVACNAESKLQAKASQNRQPELKRREPSLGQLWICPMDESLDRQRRPAK